MEVVHLAAKSDKWAKLALSNYERLAKAIAQVINLLDPDVVVLVGEMSNVDRLYDSLSRLITPWVIWQRNARRRFVRRFMATPAALAARLWPQKEDRRLENDASAIRAGAGWVYIARRLSLESFPPERLYFATTGTWHRRQRRQWRLWCK